jgi:sulfoxide reductase heme-binding subunit YedZ
MQPLSDHLWWLASRASGLVALVLVTVSVGLGLTMAGRIARRPGLAPKLAAIHEQTAVTGLVATAVHGITLLGDPWLRPGISGIALPGAIAYRPLWTALGIIAGYGGAILGLSFYIRRRIGPRLWRRAHRLTIVVYVLALGHTLGAGTDASTPWLRAFMLVTAPVIVTLFAARLVASWRARGRRSRRPAIAAPRGAPKIAARVGEELG